MAVWIIPSDQIIDYSANGDDVDSFSQKVKFCIENLFVLAQILRSNGAKEGLGGETASYEVRVNKLDNCIYMRDGSNTKWFLLGEVADHFGFTSKIADIDVDVTGISNGDVLKYDVVSNKFVPVKKDMFTEANVTTTGEKNKLVQVGADGFIHANIKGSATGISNIPVDVTGINTGDVLSYIGGEFVPVKKDKFDDEAVTTTGEANKIVKVGEDGLIHADIAGSAQKICKIPVNIKNVDDGHILRYHSSTKAFHNEDLSAVVGAGKSLILCDGAKILGDYNGSQTITVDIQEVLSQSTLFNSLSHVMRLVENLYIALDASGLNPGGYDGLSGETFYGDTADIDTVKVNVLLVVAGDDTVDVDSIEGLIEGSTYVLSDGTKTETVRVKHIIVEGGINHLILYNAVTKVFAPGSTKLVRSTCTISEGAMSGDGAVCVTNPIPLVNEVTGEVTEVMHAHLVVKHQNVMDAEIKAEIALRDGAKFVKDEVIGIGNGITQTVALNHTEDVTAYKFALYFDGVQQTSGFKLDPILGQVTFTAASNVIVSADYFYDWSAEEFVEMTKTGTYPDRRDQTRATTQFVYDGAKGSVATIRLTLKQGEGNATNEVVSAGTGKPRGFKLKHNAISNSISVYPTPTSKKFNAEQNTVIVTSPVGKSIQISYSWKGSPFSVESFACTFNE